MTTVLVALTRDTPTGRERAAGTLRWEPTARRLAGVEVVLPQGFTVALPESGDWLAVDVPASGPAWCWRVTERIPGGGGIVRYVAVPDLPGSVAYAELVDVDPATLDPSAEPEAAWWAALDGLVSLPEPGAEGQVLVSAGGAWLPVTLATVAFSGSYANLADKPAIPLILWVDDLAEVPPGTPVDTLVVVRPA